MPKWCALLDTLAMMAYSCGVIGKVSPAHSMQIKLMGTRERAAELDFSGVPLEEEVETTLKDAAKISMGTEVSDEDMLNIMELCDQARPLRVGMQDS